MQQLELDIPRLITLNETQNSILIKKTVPKNMILGREMTGKQGPRATPKSGQKTLRARTARARGAVLVAVAGHDQP
jgi:hypothetical protein